MSRTRPDAPTMVTDAYMSQASGRRTHVLFSGTNDTMTPAHIRTEGSNARIFHIGLPGIHAAMDAPCGPHANGWVEVLARARAAGIGELLVVSATSDDFSAVADFAEKHALPCALGLHPHDKAVVQLIAALALAFGPVQEFVDCEQFVRG